MLDLGNVTEEPPCTSSAPGRTVLQGWAAPVQCRQRDPWRACGGGGGVEGVLGGSRGDNLDPSVWAVWPSGFLGSPGAGETKAEVACRCFGCGRSGSSRCAPALLWGARFISRVASILIAVVWSQGGEGLGEQGLVGETLLHPVWVCPPLAVRSPVALGPRLLPNLPGGMFVKEGLCIQVGRVRVRSLQPLRFEGLTPLALI